MELAYIPEYGFSRTHPHPTTPLPESFLPNETDQPATLLSLLCEFLLTVLLLLLVCLKKAAKTIHTSVRFVCAGLVPAVPLSSNDTSSSSLKAQYDKLQRDYEAVCHESAVVAGQNERLAAELNEKDQSSERKKQHYLQEQAYFDLETQSMKRKMRNALDKAEKATATAKATQADNKALKSTLKRCQEQIKEYEQQRALDISNIQPTEQKIKGLESQLADSREKLVAGAAKIEKMEKEVKDCEKEAEDLGEQAATDMFEKEELKTELEKQKMRAGRAEQKLATATKRIAELEEWEAVGLKDRITTAATDRGTQTEASSTGTPEDNLPKETEQLEEVNEKLQAEVEGLKKRYEGAITTEAEMQALKVSNDHLETRILEVNEAKTAAEQARDGVLQELDAFRATYQRAADDGRVQADSKAKMEKAGMREEAQRLVAAWHEEKQAMQNEIGARIGEIGTLHGQLQHGHERWEAEKKRADGAEEQVAALKQTILNREDDIKRLRQTASGPRPRPQGPPKGTYKDKYEKEAEEHRQTKLALEQTKKSLQYTNDTIAARVQNDTRAKDEIIKDKNRKIKELEEELKGSRNNNQAYQTYGEKRERELKGFKLQFMEHQKEIKQYGTRIKQQEETLKQNEKMIKQNKAKEKKLVESVNRHRPVEEPEPKKRSPDDGREEEEAARPSKQKKREYGDLELKRKEP